MTISITLIIIIVTAAVSIIAFSNREFYTYLLFEPYVINARKEYHRFISHAFVHANWTHLAVNMFVLWMFGTSVEMLYSMITDGGRLLPFLGLYFGGVLFASIPSYKKHILNPSYRAVGASGAVSAVLFAQILMLPTRSVEMLFIPVPMPAWVFGGLYLAYSWYMDKQSTDNVAHDAHFYGAVFGLVYTALLEPQLIISIGSFQSSLGL
ncbi:MAG: rhomboid family intramembrane serine protease [Flavobacteriales bacterium]|nr:rhomboid family intramembrane serine protease [Flavobacteriales bacterium]MBK6944913.1 rhomboid family intramembrane serine protease [Flavobacteriales bacterium]MBK7239264.1 rhomboid family intramembrane serine protease [Flavobacteriales bacterium]MBK7297452.1 rhomboid family intramembrane serine protease [Flavobacteriales bacterium]MBP9138937.1 rhomboid family intramembrane serine protease [Flavobacteriales bacterium]